MRRKLILATLSLSLAAGAVLASCGGQGANTQSLSASPELPAVNVDLRCCDSLDNQTQTCQNWVIAPDNSTTVNLKVVNDSLDWFGENQTVILDGCSFTVEPIGATPNLQGFTSYLACNTGLTIPAGQTGTVQVSIPASLTNLVYDDWLSSGLDVYTYKVYAKLSFKGEQSGTYTLTVPFLVNFADFPIGASDAQNVCPWVNNQTY